jgi:ABC-type bacteriocin/lantibiotic exporter with double-glycine peptidase domain
MRLPILASVVIFMGFGGILPAQEIPVAVPSFTCGLNAAYMLLNKTGHHAAYAELLRDFEKQNPPDTLLAIKQVLENHGCATVGIKTNADYFLNAKGPAIVYLQLLGLSTVPENHFSFLIGASRQTGVELLDPIFNVNSASYLTWDTFCRSFQGKALILK